MNSSRCLSQRFFNNALQTFLLPLQADVFRSTEADSRLYFVDQSFGVCYLPFFFFAGMTLTNILLVSGVTNPMWPLLSPSGLHSPDVVADGLLSLLFLASGCWSQVFRTVFGA